MSDIINSPLDFLTEHSLKSPGKCAIRINNIDYTYDMFSREVGLFAKLFKSHGIGQGSLVAVYSDHEFDVLCTIFALWTIGAVCIPINPTYKTDKLQQIESTVRPDFGFYSVDYDITYDRQYPMSLIEKSNEPGNVEVVHPKADDPAMIMFTSGTSGVPKAVPITHGAIARNSLSTASRLGLTKEDVLFINTPPYTTSSIIHVLTMMSQGAQTVIDRSFLFGAAIIDKIEEHQCTCFGGVPIHFTRLLAALEEKDAPKKLHKLINSGDHLSVPVLEKLQKLMPQAAMYCIYGLTEVAGRLCVLPPELVRSKSGSVGFPIEGMSVTIRGSKLELLPAGETGEVFIQGPNLMKGYINNPEANEKSMTSVGFATGDFGYLDSDGCLYLKGRKDDIFKVGGEKVSVKMIEEALVGYEEFADAMVAPEYDEHMGNYIPCLYYVLKKDATFSRKKLLGILRKRLPQNHIPTKFVELEEIPRTSSGKSIRKVPSPGQPLKQQ
ncbi:MAG: class I adenylate-forming enzyme family protein [Leptospirales bacterium]